MGNKARKYVKIVLPIMIIVDGIEKLNNHKQRLGGKEYNKSQQGSPLAREHSLQNFQYVNTRIELP